MAKRLAERLLLLGWGSADWTIIQPLLDAGELPHLERLINEGTMGNLASLRPVVPSMLWTSMATGKRADHHGVHGAIESRPDGLGVRPVASTSLRAWPLWPIVERHGLRSAVVGWYATHPADAVGGIAVSNLYAHAQGDDAASWPMPPDAVAPATLRDVMRSLRIHPADLAPEQILHFVPRAASVEPDRDHRPAVLARLLAQCATTHAAGTWLAEHEAWDLLAVHYDMLDGVSQEFMAYRAPRRNDVSEADFERYRGVVDQVYRFHDLMLGRYMRLVGPETTIIVASDHGVWSGDRRPGLEGRDRGLAHRPYGILVARGPHVARDQLVYGATVLDVAPTVLTLLGLPVGRDMEGRVLARIFVEPVEPDYVDSHGSPTETREDDGPALEEAVRHLEALGYARAPAPEGPGVGEARLELIANEAEVHFCRGDWRKAADLFTEVLSRRPEHVIAQYRLVQCRLRGGDVAGGRRLAEELVSHHVDSLWAQLALGLVDFFEERWEEALGRFERALVDAPDLPEVHYRIGAVRLRQRRWADAEAAFRRALLADGESPDGYHGLGLSLFAQRRPAEAAESLMRSVGLVYHQPLVHFRLGAALYAAGHVDAAVESLETAVQSLPDLGEAHGMLARIHRTRGDFVRAARHEGAARHAR